MIETSVDLIRPNKIHLISNVDQVHDNGIYAINKGFENLDSETLSFIKEKIENFLNHNESQMLNNPNLNMGNFTNRIKLNQIIKNPTNAESDYYYSLNINPIKLIRGSLVLWGRTAICDYIEFNRKVSIQDITIILNIYYTILQCHKRGIDKWSFIRLVAGLLQNEKIIYQYDDMSEYRYIIIQPSKTAEYIRINHEDLGNIEYIFSRLMMDFTYGYEKQIIDFTKLIDQVNYGGVIYA